MNRIDTLFFKFINKVATEEEEQELFNLIRKPDDDENLRALIDEVMQQHMGEREMNNNSAEKVLSVILATTRPQKKIVKIGFRKWAVAAALLAVAGCIVAWLLNMRATGKSVVTTVAASTLPPVDPAKQGALLTLSDGSIVSLDSLQSRSIEPQGGTRVSVKSDQISYDDRNAKQVAWNTLSTPRGRIFHLVLPDGSRVWLNAESAIRYPTSFEGKERKVELSGEAFFEIAKNEKKPFKVSIDPKTELEVLGTSFNINSYRDEGAMRATLLSGSVRMNTGQGSGAILRPGEQAVVAQSGVKVLQADTAKVMAWRHGIFNFENADIKTVMRQLERWYDIDVVYEKAIPEITFGGKMGRDLSLQHVLRILEISKVHFRLEPDNKLIVTP